MEKEKILKVENLSVDLDGNLILEDVSFELAKGEVLAVIGPNGSGKSVMLRTLLGLIPHSGVITWKSDIKIGYAPQKLAIEKIIPLTVSEFLKLKTDKTAEILEVLDSVGISTPHPHKHHLESHILNRRLGLLSGGEFQRVLIAWSLIGSPDVLLFDEPTSGIDAGGEKTIYNLLHELQQKRNLSMILVSHDLNVVYKYAGNVMCLNRKKMCFGQPREVLNPAELSSLYGDSANFYTHDHS